MSIFHGSNAWFKSEAVLNLQKREGAHRAGKGLFPKQAERLKYKKALTRELGRNFVRVSTQCPRRLGRHWRPAQYNHSSKLQKRFDQGPKG